ncbi:Glycosyltransferase 2-like domain-containing protein [Sphingomonas antarctica]|uniref:glycosyltransferase family 2 protein n=1 Tax=Sphingomonas antarctica TaxID=2040274 RepID=UPI0039EAB180
MTTISLLTVCYNSGATIADTLRSVAAQTYPEIEHIIVDGASKDDTMAVVARDGGHVTRTVSEPDKGLYDAYNKALGLATGEVIGYLNSDDLYAHDRVIERVMRAFEDPSVEAVHGDLFYVKQDDVSQVTRYWKSRPMPRTVVRQGFHPPHPTLFLRRSVYDRVGQFDLNYRMAADVEFMNRVFYRFGVKDVHLPDVMVRMREGGVTGGNAASIKLQNDEVRRGQAANGIRYPLPLFYARKIVDRSLQRIRARLGALPTPGA